MIKFKHPTIIFATVFVGTLVLSGCGGGGGGGGGRPPSANPGVGSAGSGKITGAAYTSISLTKGDLSEIVRIPLSGADVVCGGAAVKTGAKGRFTLLAARAGKISCTVSKKGYTPEKFEIELSQGKTANATDTVLIPVSTGSLKIVSSGDPAPVSLDGLTADSLTTGVTVSGVSSGSHSVAVAAEGFESADAVAVNVKAGETARVVLELVKKTVSININHNESPVIVGETRQFSAQCGYFDGSEGGCTGKVAWDSSDQSVGIISDDGTFAAAAPGETKISATRVQSRITHPGVTVKVVCPEDTSWLDGACSADTLVSITVTPAEIQIEKGGSAELAAACVWRVAGAAPCPGLEWKASGPAIAGVDSTGIVTGKYPNTTGITASSGGITSNHSMVTVVETRYPELTCEGAGGFCLDVVGAAAGGDGNIDVSVAMSNPPAAGLGTGIITLTWEPGALAYESVTPGDGIIGIGESKAAGKLVFVFTSPAPMTADATLFTVSFSMPAGVDAPANVSIDQTLEATNFTDFGLNLISQSGIVFRDGYAGP